MEKNQIFMLELIPSECQKDDDRDNIYHIFTDFDIKSNDLIKIKERIKQFKENHIDIWDYDEIYAITRQYLEEKGYNILNYNYESIKID